MFRIFSARAATRGGFERCWPGYPYACGQKMADTFRNAVVNNDLDKARFNIHL